MVADFKQGSNLLGKILASGQVTSQLLTITGGPTGGNFAPMIGGIATAAVAYNASAATLQAALRLVAAAGVTVDVSGSNGGPYTITVTTTNGNRNQTITAGTPVFTGGTSPAVVVTGVPQTILSAVPAGRAYKLSNVLLCNLSSFIVKVWLSVVPSGGSADGTHLVVASYQLAAGDTLDVTSIKGIPIDAGTTLVLTADAAAAIDFTVAGYESS